MSTSTRITTPAPAAPTAPTAPTARHPKRAQVEQSAAHFAETTGEHEVTVLHEDGIYRHIRFGKPGTGMYSCHITTWPGHLAVTGDMGSFLFAREHDMFLWFTGGISPEYRAEKCVAHDGITHYSRDVVEFELRQQLTEWVTELREKYGTDPEDIDEDIDEASPAHVMTKRGPRPMTTVVSSLLNGDSTPSGSTPDSAPSKASGTNTVLEAAIAELQEEVDNLIEWRSGSAEEAAQALDDFAVSVILPGDDEKTFELYDTWEWDLTEWTVQFLWCLHAVRHVIATLNARETETPVAEGVTAA